MAEGLRDCAHFTAEKCLDIRAGNGTHQSPCVLHTCTRVLYTCTCVRERGLL